MKKNETDERELLAAFYGMNEAGRRALLEYGAFLQELDRYRKQYEIEGREGNVIHVKRT